MKWTTEIINELNAALAKCRTTELHNLNKCYNWCTTEMRKPNIEFELSTEEKLEYVRCSIDIVYFANNYFKTLTGNGYEQIKLRSYQEDILRKTESDRFNLAFGSRQTGMSTLIIISIVHSFVFGKNKRIGVHTTTAYTTTHLFDRIKTSLLHLPFWMQPGMHNVSPSWFKGDNGNEIVKISTTNSSDKAEPFNKLFIDNAGYGSMQTRLLCEYNVLSVIANRNSTVFIASTGGSGHNYFYKLYSDATQNKNLFKTHKVYWHMNPAMTNEYKQEMIKLLGQESWDNEYELQFKIKQDLKPERKQVVNNYVILYKEHGDNLKVHNKYGIDCIYYSEEEAALDCYSLKLPNATICKLNSIA